MNTSAYSDQERELLQRAREALREKNLKRANSLFAELGEKRTAGAKARAANDAS